MDGQTCLDNNTCCCGESLSVVEAGVDNSDWMARLPEKGRREVSLLNLSIPGSHDSLTYNLPR